MAKVEKLHIPRDRRVVVISDIHANLPYLRGLLDKVQLKKEDMLIILGDMVEKGPDSLETLRYIMGLRERCDFHAVLGNCDAWHMEVDSELPEARMHYWVGNYLRRQQKGLKPGLLIQMCQECGVTLGEEPDLEYMRRELRRHFVPELDFLRSLPHILDAEDFTFVHGALPPEGVPWEEADGWSCMKNDRFALQGRRFDKWVVAGHTPVHLYHENVSDARPIIDRESRIISIDGGCVVKNDGQLNALIIEDGTFRYTWYDPYPLCRALEAQQESERSFYIPWGDCEVEVTGRDGDFVRIRHLRTLYEMYVPEDLLYHRADRLCVDDCTDYCPLLHPGDVFYLVRQTSHGAWIKKDGVSGWYGGAYEPI